MVRNYIALITIVALLGFCLPVMAGDLVSPNLLPNSSMAVRHNIPATIGAFSMPEGTPQAGQAPSTTPAPASSSSGELTTKGKVLKWVGIGLMAEGALDGVYGVAILSDPCKDFPSGTCTSNYSTVRGAYLGACAGVVAVGAILLVKGLHSKM